MPIEQLTLKKQYTFEDLLEIEKSFIINYCKTAHLHVFLAVKEIFERQVAYDADPDHEALYIIVRSADPLYYHLVLTNDHLRSDLFEEGDCEEENNDE